MAIVHNNWKFVKCLITSVFRCYFGVEVKAFFLIYKKRSQHCPVIKSDYELHMSIISQNIKLYLMTLKNNSRYYFKLFHLNILIWLSVLHITLCLDIKWGKLHWFSRLKWQNEKIEKENSQLQTNVQVLCTIGPNN